MNCAEVRRLLPVLLVGDASAAEAARVEEHLGGCPACRRERAAVEQLGALLGETAAPPVSIDLPRLYREAAARQERRLRRWRRLALVSAAAAAAVFLIAAALRLEVRLEAHEAVVRWGAPPTAPAAPPIPPEAPPVPERWEPVFVEAPPAELEEQIRLLTELTRLLAADLDARDQRQRRDVARLQAELLQLRQQVVQWRLATERDVAALYATQYPSKKGNVP
jgi:hypothetical protein